MTLENKTFTIILLVALALGIAGLLIIPSLVSWWKGNLFEKADLLRQKMAPALNETTGFLLVSYVVILCIGNVIMKTSPKYLTTFSEESIKTTKVKGVVSFLQESNMSWLPFMIASIGIAISSFIPFKNKKGKIIVIGIILIVSIIIALLFNEISNFFRKEESFTNVKEEFGHTVKDTEDNDTQHNLKITVQVRDTSIEQLKGIKDMNGSHFVDIKNDSGGGHSRDWSSVDPSKYDVIELGTDATYNAKVDLLYEPIKNDSYGGKKKEKYNKESRTYDVYYSNEVANEPEFLTSLTKLTDKTEIDVEKIATQTYYFHLFPKDIKIFDGEPSKKEFVQGAKYTTNPETGICTLGGEEELKKDDEVFIFPPNGIKYDHSLNQYRYTINSKDKDGKTVAPTSVPWTGSKKKSDRDVILITKKTLEKSPKTSSKFSIKNMPQFLIVELDAVKKSVSDSYIAYYCLVWGSFLVYTIVNAIQKDKWWFILPIPPTSLRPFMGAALVETLLIAQSNSSLDESDVGAFGEASPIFNYAVAGFATRIATVVAFLSYIIMKVKD